MTFRNGLQSVANLARVVLCALLLCGCAPASGRESSVAASGIRADFACKHDAGPSVIPDLDADALFDYARHIDYLRGRRDFRSSDIEEFNRISRFYRIASAHGSADATEALRDLQWRLTDSTYDGVVTELRRNRDEEADRLTALLTWQYPSRGYRLQAGMLAQSWKMSEAFILYRKAADLGNAQAQYRLGQYLDIDSVVGAAAFGAKRKDIQYALQLYRCAAGQGHPDAMAALAVRQVDERRYAEAIAGFQQAVKAGNVSAAGWLREAFGGDSTWPPSLGMAKDAVRYERYDKIRSFLIENQDFAPTVPDLDRIVPLPPAPLPVWDGTFEWKKALLAPREAPAEALVKRMAEDKGLDPRTGLAVSADAEKAMVP